MKLKPFIFVQGKYPYNTQSETQQLMLLRALRITQDPRKLKQMIGVRDVVDVYREIDKIANQQKYHKALAKIGITFDYIAKGIKQEIDTAEKSADRLTGLNMLLKSTGVDKYENTSNTGGSWEEALLKLSETQKEGAVEVTPYEVIEPPMPENVRLAKEKANKEAKGLYE